jgi:hypothetical protein
VELPRGITGFGHVDDPPLPVCDFYAFRGHCHTAARLVGAQVLTIEPPGRRVSTSFAQALLDFADSSVAVLLNAHFPVIAFAAPLVEGETCARFCEAPLLAAVFRQFGLYEMPNVAELEAPMTLEVCRHLAPTEMDQVTHWRPRRVGDVVFNFWD